MMDRNLSFVPAPERDQTSRALLDWLNLFPNLPFRVDKIEAEYLAASTSMALFSESAPVKTREFISGAYEAQFQFSILYRSAPASSAQRLEALETLNQLAGWAEHFQPLPNLGPGLRAVSIERSAPAVLAARFDDGLEDYQIFFTLSYEVNPNHSSL